MSVRAILFLCCRSHEVAFCEHCRKSLTLEELVYDASHGEAYRCPGCAHDVTRLVMAHTRLCHYFTSMKPPAKVEPPGPPPKQERA